MDNVLRSGNSNLDIVKDLRDKYGPIFRMWLGNKLMIVLSEADDLEVSIYRLKCTYFIFFNERKLGISSHYFRYFFQAQNSSISHTSTVF